MDAREAKSIVLKGLDLIGEALRFEIDANTSERILDSFLSPKNLDIREEALRALGRHLAKNFGDFRHAFNGIQNVIGLIGPYWDVDASKPQNEITPHDSQATDSRMSDKG